MPLGASKGVVDTHHLSNLVAHLVSDHQGSLVVHLLGHWSDFLLTEILGHLLGDFSKDLSSEFDRVFGAATEGDKLHDVSLAVLVEGL